MDVTIRSTDNGKVEAIIKHRCYTYISKHDDTEDAIAWVKNKENELKNSERDVV